MAMAMATTSNAARQKKTRFHIMLWVKTGISPTPWARHGENIYGARASNTAFVPPNANEFDMTVVGPQPARAALAT